ncbi:hypothetical protein Drose_26875 [Dactylosporangium roseum]|uniref:Uncharacterized protein n=1 Tax=Dactylosporangium roseum TaxID=47989 RepID=A0ABY5YYH7_9ACTN|nr:hypothetical protein [Dactylosporangium roseum]UWZ34796.1 hypothetical protein Drose_26875 [Dactylosporangium roseum]
MDAIYAVARQASKVGEDSERAYLTARTFEALAEYLGDAADHERCIQTVAQFSRSSAVALAGRWRSRRFGAADRVLQALLEFETGLSTRASNGAVALLPLAETFDVRGVLKDSLQSGTVDAARLFDVVSRYDRTAWHHREYFDELHALARRFSVDLDRTSYAHDSYRQRVFDPQKHSSHYTSSSWFDRDATYEARRTADLQALNSLDLSDPDDLEAARRMCENQERSVHTNDFVDAVLATPARHLSRAIGNVRNNSRLSAYIYRSLLERLTAASGLPRATVDATRDLALHAVHRFCDQIAGAYRYQGLEPELLSRATGRRSDDLYDLALVEVGARGDFLDADACFGLVYTLAPRLLPEQARDAFDQAIAELDYLNDADTGDGPWRADLAPSDDLHRCVAGYIWSVLADPDESIRWRAAHAVHLLCELGAQAELRALAEFAGTVTGGPFNDARLPFYDKNALMWLLLAIERASTDSAAELGVFEDILRKAAFGTEQHILLREAARHALTALDDHGVIDVGSSGRDRLAAANRPVGQVLERTRRPSWYQRTRRAAGDGYEFRFDFDEHWIEPLARCFGLQVDDVTRRISDVITGSWAVEVSAGRAQDPRQIRNILKDESTFYYKSDMPTVHDLDFYLRGPNKVVRRVGT